MQSRRGISLVELLLTLSACTVILTMSTALIHRMMNVQSIRRTDSDLERTALRLATVFRADVHRASDLLAQDDRTEEELLRLQSSDGQTIHYRHSEGALQRLIMDEEAIVARDEFRFTPEAQFTAERDQTDIVALLITSQPIEASQKSRKSVAHVHRVAVRLEALLGRDRTTIEVAAQQEASR
jgi:hypothetical protein